MDGREVEVSGFEEEEDGRREDEEEGTLSCQSNTSYRLCRSMTYKYEWIAFVEKVADHPNKDLGQSTLRQSLIKTAQKTRQSI